MDKTAVRNWNLVRAANANPTRFWTPAELAGRQAEWSQLKTNLRNPANLIWNHDQQAMNRVRWDAFKGRVQNGLDKAQYAAMQVPTKLGPNTVEFMANYGDDAIRGVHGALNHLGLG